MVLMVLFGFLGGVSALTASGISKTSFLGAVYAAPSFPLEGAIVTASGLEGYGSASTDSLGHYSITEGLMTGNYTVTASAEGYLDATIEDVVVTEGLVTSNIDFLLDISGGISGIITEAGTGSPLQGVVVTAESSAGGGVSESAFTGANGHYLINTNLVTGTYNVTAIYALGHITNETSGIAVTAGIETKNIDLVVEKSGIITGTVTDSVSSAPLADISIIAADAGGAYGGFASTDLSGMYRIDTNLATGTYNVSAIFPEGYIRKEISGIMVIAGSETIADLSLDPSGVISGTVTAASNGQPVAEASVSAFSDDFMYFGFAETDATGHYRIASGLGTQTYTVMASFGIAFNTTLGVAVVAGSETSNVDMQLEIVPSGVISGRVTNTTGSPIEGAFVTAEGLGGSGSAFTDSNGDYTISTGLDTGMYTVNASAFGYTMVSLTDVNVVVDQVTSNVDFQLPTALSGTISGTVMADFVPIPEYSSTLVAFVFAASTALVAFGKLRAVRRKTLDTLD